MRVEYQPGVCNIGRFERRRRFALGVISLLIVIGIVAGVLSLGWPSESVVVTWPLMYAAAVGFIQYRVHFCGGFALLGVFNVGDGTRKVTDPRATEADRRRALRLHIWATIVSVIGLLITYGLVVIGLS